LKIFILIAWFCRCGFFESNNVESINLRGTKNLTYDIGHFEIQYRNYRWEGDGGNHRLCLSVKGAGKNRTPTDGSDIILLPCYGHSENQRNQLWRFSENRIQNVANTNLCLGPAGWGAMKNILAIVTCTGDDTKIKYSGKKLRFVFESITQKSACIASLVSSPKKGTGTEITVCKNDRKQQWTLEDEFGLQSGDFEDSDEDKSEVSEDVEFESTV